MTKRHIPLASPRSLSLSLSHSFPISAVQRLDFIWQFIAEDICGYVAKKMEIEMREDLKCVVEVSIENQLERVRERVEWVNNDKVFLELAHVSDKCIYWLYKERIHSQAQQKDKRNISCCMHIKTNMDIGCGIMWALQRVREATRNAMILWKLFGHSTAQSFHASSCTG